MNIKTNPPAPFGTWRRLAHRGERQAVAALAVAFTLTSFVGAQSASDENDVFTLTPFEVNAEKDQGYVAENTLSGTRLNTAVKDLAVTMSILTPQFWEDTGFTDINDMLIFTPGAEKEDTQFGGGNSRAQYWGDNTMFRGVHTENIVRNQFRSNIPSDTYNVSRFEISRGPNAVLFGVTREPAGLVNRTTQDATFTKSNEVQFRLDENGSFRTNVSLNHVLIDDVLSARISLLNDENNHWIEPGFQDQQRAYAALNYTPNKKLSIKLRAEYLYWDRAAVDPSVANDRVTTWINSGMPGVNVSATATVPASAYPAGTARLTTATQYAYINDGSGRMMNLRNFAQGSQTNLITGAVASLPSDFAPLDFNYFGAAGSQHFKGHNVQAAAQFRATDKLNFEFAINDEYVLYDFIAMGDSNLYVDANQTLDDGITANPHFGDYFALATAGFRLKQDRYLRGARASGSYTHDFGDSDGLAWLGKHDFVAMLETNTDEFYWDTLRMLSADAPDNNSDADFRARVITYIDMEKKQLSGPTWSRDFVDQINSIPGNDYQWKNFFNGGGANNNRTEIDSALFVWQSRFWNGKIIPTLGWREDHIDQYVTAPSPDNNARLSAREVGYTFDAANSGLKPNTSNQGVVFHAIENKGAIDHISLFFNQADSFAASNFNLRPDRTSLPAKVGETEDYGIRFGLMNGKISGVFTKFDMNVKNTTASTEWRPLWTDLGDLFNAIGKTEYYQVPQISDTQDIASKGWEFQLNANVTDNWRVMFGFDHYATFDSNVAPTTLALIDQNTATWQSNANVIVPERFINGNPMTVGELLGIMTVKKDLQLAQVGGYKNNERQYKGTFLTNYEFKEGGLKGFSFGGNAVWRDKPATGFPFIIDPVLGAVVDVNNPFFGTELFTVSLQASYRRKILNDRVNWKIQLNVNNVGDQDPFVTRHAVVASDPRTPIVDKYSRGNPQMIVLTNTFKW